MILHPTKGDVKTTISSSGTLEGVDSNPIYLPEGILITKVLVSEGDVIKKGTKIAEIDKASVAEVLLTVRDSIDTLEDNIDDLDDDELGDSSSDDYLKKLAYDKELVDLNELEENLGKIIMSSKTVSEASPARCRMAAHHHREVREEAEQGPARSKGDQSCHSQKKRRKL